MYLKRSASQIAFNLKQQLLKGCMIDLYNVSKNYCNNGIKIKVMETGRSGLIYSPVGF